MSESHREKHVFQAEVSRLLQLMINSVYSEPEIFLRELISNASDACDKLRYLSITEPALCEAAGDFHIGLNVDPSARTLTVADNGVGMSHDELIANLGTIAHSGTGGFIEQLAGDAAKTPGDVNLIGQFGIGFYASFIVADKVELISRRAGEAAAWRWTSDGAGEFEVSPAEKSTNGTEIVLHLRAGMDEFLQPHRLRGIVKSYSEHISYPITLRVAGVDAKPEDAEPINSRSALWMRPKSEISDAQYKEFYQGVAHGFDDPWLTIHYKAEGKIEFTALLFIPSTRPFDLFDPARSARLRLYVKRVFITDEADILPGWLRFVRGVADSQDMPLNLSREMLQNNPVVSRIKTALITRVLSELKKSAEKDAVGYAVFWRNFGAVLKEGLYEDAGRHEELLKLARFSTTKSNDELRSLDEYVSQMPVNQTAIYYISGESPAAVRRSPQIEGFVARGVEVLLLSDPVDDFWIAGQQGYEGKPFKSVTQGAADLTGFTVTEEQTGALSDGELALLIALCKQTLGDAVSDVRRSERLTGSAVCLVAADAGLDMNLARVLSKHKQAEMPQQQLVLELNPAHPLIRELAQKAKAGGASATLEDAAHLLLDQARILEGEPLTDPAAFAKRMANIMLKGMA